jgi:hypothetical protein
MHVSTTERFLILLSHPRPDRTAGKGLWRVSHSFQERKLLPPLSPTHIMITHKVLLVNHQVIFRLHSSLRVLGFGRVLSISYGADKTSRNSSHGRKGKE